MGAYLILFAGLAFLASAPAGAQDPDYCSAPLTADAEPAAALLWKLRCQVQILEGERGAEANERTRAELENARLNALLRSAMQAPNLPDVLKGSHK